MSANLSYVAFFMLKILDVCSSLCVLLHGYFKDDTLLIGRLEWRQCYFKLFFVYSAQRVGHFTTDHTASYTTCGLGITFVNESKDLYVKKIW